MAFEWNTPDGGNYWGRCGRHPDWDRYFASGKKARHPLASSVMAAGGVYAGVLVVLVALWTVFQAFRSRTRFSPVAERKLLWFWSGVALLCVIGGFRPLRAVLPIVLCAAVRLDHAEPFQVLSSSSPWILAVILFAYGVHGLSRRCLKRRLAATRGLSAQLQAWWAKAALFDKNWVKGSAVALAASLLGWLLYSGSRETPGGLSTGGKV